MVWSTEKGLTASLSVSKGKALKIKLKYFYNSENLSFDQQLIGIVTIIWIAGRLDTELKFHSLKYNYL